MQARLLHRHYHLQLETPSFAMLFGCPLSQSVPLQKANILGNIELSVAQQPGTKNLEKMHKSLQKHQKIPSFQNISRLKPYQRKCSAAKKKAFGMNFSDLVSSNRYFFLVRRIFRFKLKKCHFPGKMTFFELKSKNPAN